jgi:pimeloyl-ACP methyl ester carboxylesterase
MARPPRRSAPTARLADVELAPLEGVAMWDGRDVDVAGQRIFVRTTPATSDDAEPALFVHGLAGASINWTDLAALLRNRLAIEALDLPGFARSGPALDGDYSLQSQARTVITYLEQSGRGPVHLVGNSMGGAISLLVAEQRPDLIRTLTLISPAVPDNKLRAHALKSNWRMGLLVVPIIGMIALRKLAKIPVETRVKGTLALCLADPSRLSKARYDDMIAEAKVHAAHSWGDVAVLRSTRGLVRSQFLRNRSGWRGMRDITAPTLVMWGDEDKLVAADLAPYVAAEIPDSRLLVLEHIGHVAMIEDPQTTARAVIALLDDAASGLDAEVPSTPADRSR